LSRQTTANHPSAGVDENGLYSKQDPLSTTSKRTRENLSIQVDNRLISIIKSDNVVAIHRQVEQGERPPKLPESIPSEEPRETITDTKKEQLIARFLADERQMQEFRQELAGMQITPEERAWAEELRGDCERLVPAWMIALNHISSCVLLAISVPEGVYIVPFFRIFI
jgi:hypothetical protein